MQPVDYVINVLKSDFVVTEKGNNEQTKVVEKFKLNLFTAAKIHAWWNNSEEITQKDIQASAKFLRKSLPSKTDMLLDLIKIGCSAGFGIGLKTAVDGQTGNMGWLIISLCLLPLAFVIWLQNTK